MRARVRFPKRSWGRKCKKVRRVTASSKEELGISERSEIWTLYQEKLQQLKKKKTAQEQSFVAAMGRPQHSVSHMDP